MKHNNLTIENYSKLCRDCINLLETDSYGEFTSPTVILFGIDRIKAEWKCWNPQCDNCEEVYIEKLLEVIDKRNPPQ